jgi:hypothetical protein
VKIWKPFVLLLNFPVKCNFTNSRAHITINHAGIPTAWHSWRPCECLRLVGAISIENGKRRSVRNAKNGIYIFVGLLRRNKIHIRTEKFNNT